MTSVDHTRQARIFSAADKALCATFFFLPVNKPMMFFSIALATVLLVAGGGLESARRDWRALPWSVPALILALLPVLSPLIHPNALAGPGNLGLAYFWLFAFVTFFAARRFDIVPWMQAFLCGVFVAFVHSQLTNAGLPALPWTPAALANYILYSQFLAIAVVVLSVLYRHETQRRLRLRYMAALVLFALALASGDGRSGLLSVVVLLPFIVRNLFPRVGLGKMLLACVLAVGVLLLTPNVQKRIQAGISDIELMQQQVKNTSLGYRADMWFTAVDLVREHPLLGAGASGFRERWHSAPRAGQAVEFVEPHNAYLFYAVSYGLPGLFALVWLYAAMLLTGWRRRASLEGGIAFGFAVICVLGSFTNTMFLGAASHMTMMLFIGLQGGMLKREESVQ